MRRIYNITILLSILFIGFIACNKAEENNMNQNSENNVHWTAEDLRIQNAILDFQSKIKNNSFKDGETLGLDSVIWCLENLINYNYSTPDSSFENLTIDTTFVFDFNVDNDMVSFSDITDAAFAIEDHVLTFLNQMPEEEKFVIASDITIKNNNFKSGETSIQATVWYGSAYLPNSPCFPPFEDDEYWMWGLDFGGCGQNSATTSDAAEKIEYKLNHPRCYLQDNSHTFIGSTMTRDMYDPRIEYINPDDDYPNDGWLDYYGYWKDVTNVSTEGCMNPDEMNFYLQGALHIIDNELQKIHDNNPGESWKFLSIDVTGELIPGGTPTIFYGMDMLYGKRVVYVNPID